MSEDRTRAQTEESARARMDGSAWRGATPRDLSTTMVILGSMAVAVAYLFLSPPFGLVREWLEGIGLPLPAVDWPAAGASLGIHVWMMGQGIAAALAGLARFSRENGALDYLALRADTAAKRIAAERATGGSVHLDEIHDDLMPPARAGAAKGREHAVLRMVEGLHISAQTLRIDPIAIVVATYLPEMMEASRRLRGLQTTAIRLGILGTFGGLVMALVPVADIFQSRTEGGQAGTITFVLSALSVAFLTSIAGLVAALLLQMLASGLQAEEQDFARRLEEVAARIQMIFALSRQDGRIFSAMESLSNALERAQNDLGEKAKIVADAGHFVGRKIEDHGDVLDGRLTALGGARDGLLVMAEQQKAQIDRLVTVHGEMARLDERLKAAFDAVGDRQIEALRVTSTATLQALRATSQTTIEAIRGAYGREALDALRQEAEARFLATASVLEAAAEAQGKGLGRRLDEIADRLAGSVETRLGEGREMGEAFDDALFRLERLVGRQTRLTGAALAVASVAVLGLVGLGGWEVWTALPGRIGSAVAAPIAGPEPLATPTSVEAPP